MSADANVTFGELRPGDMIISPSATRFIIAVTLAPGLEHTFNFTIMYRCRLGAFSTFRDGIFQIQFNREEMLGTMFSNSVVLLRATST